MVLKLALVPLLLICAVHCNLDLLKGFPSKASYGDWDDKAHATLDDIFPKKSEPTPTSAPSATPPTPTSTPSATPPTPTSQPPATTPTPTSQPPKTTPTPTSTPSATPPAPTSQPPKTTPTPSSLGCYVYKCDKKATGFRVDNTLTNEAVQNSTFGLKQVFKVDGQVYAQPLYAPSVYVNGQPRNLLVIATMNSSIYVYDADTQEIIWQRNYVTANGPVLTADVTCGNVDPYYGILSTPAIVGTTLYFVTYLKEGSTTVELTYRLHKTDLITGNNDMVTQPFAANVSGISFNARQQLQRSAVYIDDGHVFVAFASHCDQAPWYPWVFAFDAEKLTQTAVYGYPPMGDTDAEGPSIWESGATFVPTGNGKFVAVTGNGDFSPNSSPAVLGDSVIEFDTSLEVVDYFTPSNQAYLQQNDLDLGSCGPFNLDDKYVVTSSKEGTFYALDISSLGKYNPDNNNGNAHQVLTKVFGPIYGSLSYFPAAKAIFGHGLGDVMKRVDYTNGNFTVSAVQGSVPIGFPPTTPIISATSETAVDGLVYEASRANGLTIYNAANLTTTYQSPATDASQNCGLPTASSEPTKFQVPLIASGHVYYGCDGAVLKYGNA